MRNAKFDLADHDVIRSRRKSLSLEVTADARLIIRSPMHLSKKQIQLFIHEKHEWILEKLQKANSRQEKIQPKQFRHGEEFLYLGKLYPLHIQNNQESPLFFEEGFYLSAWDVCDAKEHVETWYKKEAMEKISKRVYYYAKMMNLCFKEIKISNAKRRWGSCSAQNHLNFSWRLIMAPLEVMDYVVVHELSHIPHKNHSSCFWKQVELILPNYQKTRKWLREFGYQLDF